jgi:CoA:oxalate CoA-transferase
VGVECSRWGGPSGRFDEARSACEGHEASNGEDERPMIPGQGTLSHIKVLDITTFLSGPYATQVLGDLGADVIKVEQITGDDTRRLPPNFIAGDSAYYHSINRNKKSISVNLRDKAGQDLVRRLAANCDVLIENMRPGGLARYGLGWEALSKEHPRLIYASLSGFGQDGPYRDHPAYDMVVQALSGGMSLTGEPEGRPVRSGVPIGDLAAGLYTVIGITSALEARHRTGKGQYIDVSMLDCQVAMLCYQAAYFLASSKVPGPQGRAHESIPTYRSFTAGDGLDFVICANTDRMWRSLCEVIGRLDLRDDERLATRQGRYDHREEIWATLEGAFKARTADEWVAALRSAEVPVGVVNTLDRSLSDPQVLHRGMVLDIPGPEGVHVKVAGNPLKMSGNGHDSHRFPPRLGQDTRDVLAAELGLSQTDIDALSKAGVVRTG